MKKSIFYLLIGTLFITNCISVAAQSSSSASSESVATSSASASEDKDIENLKERLATKVEEK